MREDNQVQSWEILDLDRRVSEALGPQTIAEPGMLTLVEEIWIRQDREPSKPDYGGRRSNKVD
jgi:hypothetical protein